MHSGYDEHRQAVTDDLATFGVLRRYRLLMLGASDEKAAIRLLPFLIVFIVLPVGIGALVEDQLGVWTFTVVFAVLVVDIWLFLKVFRWAGLHGLTIARLGAGT